MATSYGTRLLSRLDDLGEALSDMIADLRINADQELAERIQYLLVGPKRWELVLESLAGTFLGEQVEVSMLDQRAVHWIGQRLAERLDQLHKNQAAIREQRDRIKTIWKRKTPPQLKTMDPEDFEYWVAGYFSKKRFRRVLVTSFSHDYGIDIDMTCRNGSRAIAQCKKYTKDVSRPVVQQVFGVMHAVSAKRCYVVTSGEFTGPAIEFATEHRDIFLIDGKQLVQDSARYFG